MNITSSILKDKDSLTRFNVIAFILIIEFFFLLIVYKIVHVPITFDEMATAVFNSKFPYREIMIHPQNLPNNHIFNTICTKFFMSMFGTEQWVIRIPNLLSFLIYAFAVIRINKNVLKLSSIFFVPALFLFITNPYLLDFFGLCRGYGISSALCLLSVSYFISGFGANKSRNIWSAFFLAILASYANFTLLIFFVAAAIVTWLFFLIQYIMSKKSIYINTLFLILFCVLYGILIANPIISMQTTNQFQYWEELGFYNGTIYSIFEQFLYGSSKYPSILIHFLSIFSIVVVLGNLIYSFYNFIKHGKRLEYLNTPVFIVSAITFLTAFINIMQCLILHTPNLVSRTALFFFPLFIASLVTSISLITEMKAMLIKSISSLIICVILIFHLTNTMSLKYVKEWWFDQYSLDVIDYFKKTKPNSFVSLKTSWLLQPSLCFYKLTGKAPLIDLRGYDMSIDVNTNAEYYYINAEDYPKLASKFEIIYKFSESQWLLKRRNN